jgi:hypothetical protein
MVIEAMGRLVRKVWIEWAREQPNPKPSWLVEWEGLSEPDKEVDCRIGEAVANAERTAIIEWLRTRARLSLTEARYGVETIGTVGSRDTWEATGEKAAAVLVPRDAGDAEVLRRMASEYREHWSAPGLRAYLDGVRYISPSPEDDDHSGMELALARATILDAVPADDVERRRDRIETAQCAFGRHDPERPAEPAPTGPLVERVRVCLRESAEEYDAMFGMAIVDISGQKGDVSPKIVALIDGALRDCEDEKSPGVFWAGYRAALRLVRQKFGLAEGGP